MRLSRIALGVALATQLALMVSLVLWCGIAAGLLLSAPLLPSTIGLAFPRARRGEGGQVQDHAEKRVKKQVYTAGWSTMLVVFYIAALLAEGVAMPQRRGIAQALSAVAVLDFVSLVLFVRLTARERAGPASRTESSAGAAH